MLFLKLFFEFFKTGLFSIGGGLATVPFLQDISAKTGWFSFHDLADMIAVAESTPGPLGVNMATYVGYTTGLSQYGLAGGILGAAIATLGLVVPSIIVILIIAFFLSKFKDNKYVKAVFYGLRPASVGLISAAGIGIVLIAFFNAKNIYSLANGINFKVEHFILAAVILIASRWIPKVKDLHPICFILFAAVVGVVFNFAA
ncbi:MAG: chromate transporter [Lachnospiraceae bacterium]|nr:chromate transporter [Lachnospiraceae bacterium]